MRAIFQMPVDKANSIAYAFIGFDQNGNVSLVDSNSDAKQLPQIATLRAQYPYLNASLAFGGWTLSTPFSALAANPQAVQTFAANAVAAMKELQMNGIYIDWEYPVIGTYDQSNVFHPGTPQDAQNYFNLLQTLRTALNQQAQKDSARLGVPVKYYLEITGAGGIDKLQALDNADPGVWQKIASVVDYVGLMAYDFHGAFDQGAQPPYNVSDFMSAMALDPQNDPTIQSAVLKTYNIQSAVNSYLNYGFKPSQILLGIPAYGRMEQIAQTGAMFGLYQTITGTPNGEYDNTGVFDYKCIADHGQQNLPNDCYGTSANLFAGLNFVNPTTNLYGKYSLTPWAYSSNLFLTYDDNNSAAYKANWAKQQGLGGVMFWSFSGDLPDNDPSSLVNAAYQIFQPGRFSH